MYGTFLYCVTVFGAMLLHGAHFNNPVSLGNAVEHL